MPGAPGPPTPLFPNLIFTQGPSPKCRGFFVSGLRAERARLGIGTCLLRGLPRPFLGGGSVTKIWAHGNWAAKAGRQWSDATHRRREVAARPFRGRVASIWGRSPAVLSRGAASQVHYFSQPATGNLHEGPGLWQGDIPTWVEYNRLMTPARFVFQAADLRMMRSAGVRFVI
jgi:hypothetical protein